MYIPKCVPCLFFSGWVVTTDVFLPGSSTWRKMRFTTLTSNKKWGGVPPQSLTWNLEIDFFPSSVHLLFPGVDFFR